MGVQAVGVPVTLLEVFAAVTALTEEEEAAGIGIIVMAVMVAHMAALAVVLVPVARHTVSVAAKGQVPTVTEVLLAEAGQIPSEWVLSLKAQARVAV